MRLQPEVSNYYACFVDLLGQKDALKGQVLLPLRSEVEEFKAFCVAYEKTIESVRLLQKYAEIFVVEDNNQHSFRPFLAEDKKKIYDTMQSPKPKIQRWSDGLVLFHSLATVNLINQKSEMQAIYEIIKLSGILCLFMLVEKFPIRGGIDVGWGVELNDGELNGAVVANSYKLESQAGHPRMVIGELAYSYLETQKEEKSKLNDELSKFDLLLVNYCLSMIIVDTDGKYIVDYLGRYFRENILNDTYSENAKKAYVFICNEYEKFKNEKCEKLRDRYSDNFTCYSFPICNQWNCQ